MENPMGESSDGVLRLDFDQCNPSLMRHPLGVFLKCGCDPGLHSVSNRANDELHGVIKSVFSTRIQLRSRGFAHF